MFCLITSITIAQKSVKSNSNSAKEIIKKVVTKTGSYELLKQLKDVQFDYTFHSPKNNKNDISVERYIFKNEVSWGNYQRHEVFVFPTEKESVIQFYDGNTTAKLMLGKTAINNPKTLQSVIFLRKANFYWFTMIPKLLDEGIVYEQLENRIHKGINYKIVKIGFEKGVGEVQDDFILYINPKTFLIDQFIFTVKGSGLGISMMEVEYETVQGYTFMAKRKVISGAEWDGSVLGDVLFTQTTENVRFNNGFTKKYLVENM